MKKRCPSIRAQKGFLLIELLIAGVIIAMTSSLLIGGLRSANRSGELRVQQAVGAQLLANQLALMGDQITAETPHQGACPEPYGDSAWTLKVQDTALLSVKQVELELTHQGHTFHVVTYRGFKEPQT